MIKNIIGLFLLVISIGVSTITLQRMTELREEYNNVYELLTMTNRHIYTIMDTEVRIFHYAKGHKKPVIACPECDEIIKKGLNIPENIKINRNF